MRRCGTSALRVQAMTSSSWQTVVMKRVVFSIVLASPVFAGCSFFSQDLARELKAKERAELAEQRKARTLEEFSGAQCDELESLWPTYKKDVVLGPGEESDWVAFGERVAECQEWDLLWTGLMPTTSGRQESLIAALRGVELHASLADVGPRVGEEGIPRYALETFFREMGPEATSCEHYRELEPDDNALLFSFSIVHMVESSCDGTAALASAALEADSAQARLSGCDALGRVGTVAHLERVRILADNDPFMDGGYYDEDYGEIPVRYPVRDSCVDAVRKIKLRATEPAGE